MLHSARTAISRWDAQFGTDDARTWAEVLGSVLAFGLFVRASAHVWAALIADRHLPEGCDPHLTDTDISLRSPIVGLNGHRLEPEVRFVTALVGLGAWTLLVPVERPWPVVDYWLMLNLAVPIGDPAAYLLHRFTNTTQKDTQ